MDSDVSGPVVVTGTSFPDNSQADARRRVMDPTSDRSLRRFRYRPEIDGLRGIAVLLVILFHFHLGFSGGFVGVDIFLVISGYVITRSVIPSFEDRTFSVSAFWIRRVRRLYPAHIVMVLITLLVGTVVLTPDDLTELAESALLQPIAAANFYFWAESGYWAPAAEEQPLLHTWSLAIEEQFYLLFALLLVRFQRGRTAICTLIALTVASFAWNLICTERFPSSAFFLLPTRIWEFGIGILLAVLHAHAPEDEDIISRRRWQHPLLGLGLIAAIAVLYDRSTPFPGWAAVLPCLGTAVVLHGTLRETAPHTRRLLTWGPLVHIGKLSYSWYLWHWPVYVFLSYQLIGDLHLGIRMGAMGFSWCLAMLSYRWIETPFRSRQVLASPRRFLSTAATVTAGLLAACGVLHVGDGFPSRFPVQPGVLVEEKGEPLNVPSYGRTSDLSTLPIVGARNDVTPTVLLWGDSHASALIPAFHELGVKENISVMVAHQPGVPPLLDAWPWQRGDKYSASLHRIASVIREQQIEHVVLAARWNYYVHGSDDGDRSHLLCQRSTWVPKPETSAQVLLDSLSSTCDRLNQSGATVWIIRQVPYQPHHKPNTLLRLAAAGKDLNSLAVTLTEHRMRSREIDRLLDCVTGTSVHVLDPTPELLDAQQRCRIAADGKALYRDDDHLSRSGSLRLQPVLRPIFTGSNVSASQESNDRRFSIQQVSGSLPATPSAVVR